MPDNQFLSAKARPGQKRFVAETDEQGLGAVDAVADETAPASMWGEAWKQLRRRPIFWISAILILGALILALFPGLITQEDPTFGALKRSYAAPSPGHPFGFDQQGHDIFARTVYGARASVTVGVLTTAIVVLLGSTIGALAGFFGGWVDALLARFTDVFFAVPFVLAAIVVMQMFKGRSSITTVVMVLALFGWPQIARITRGAVMSVKNEDYVTAARSLGSGRLAILLRHVMPNAAAPIIVTATVQLGTFIVSEATLSFPGLGLPPTMVSWGADIATAQVALRDHVSVLLYPAGALALTVLGFIMMGDAVRDALDPKARK
ncbi:Glutathione transport system permease protein gsiD [Actinomyces bovis]|uniref:Glutathione transport system permease protein gsiD n=1 Tax=Actinomyces bovis TaxID=1658 RepID=A0ABY1VN83_9ACTO|nr:ABC transporter permease [Actinomyces bovis]SPT53212.1 Glutathione transport system permease protein gsiD [Actinomyces bovis]VEG52441.1 Glutathione transport system permease protein gsiD [Actinomyces israelii]